MWFATLIVPRKFLALPRPEGGQAKFGLAWYGSCLSLLPSGPAAPLETSTTSRTLVSRVVKHSVPQQPIGFRLITAAIGLKPVNDVGIQAHGHRFLFWPVELADLGAAPIEYRRGIRKINVFVFFCGDGSDVPFLLPCELPHRLSFRGRPRRGLRSSE